MDPDAYSDPCFFLKLHKMREEENGAAPGVLKEGSGSNATC